MLCCVITRKGLIQPDKAADLAAVSHAKAVVSRIKARTLKESSDKPQQRCGT